MHLCMQVNRPRLKRRRTCRSCLRQPEDTLVGACKNTSSSIWTMQRTDCPSSGKRQSCTFFPRIKPLRHTQPQTVFVIKQHIIQYRRRQVIGQVHTQLERVRQFVVCIDFPFFNATQTIPSLSHIMVVEDWILSLESTIPSNL